MKKNKLFALVLTAAMVVSTVACSSGTAAESTEKSTQQSTENNVGSSNKEKTSLTRHPLYIASDKLKAGITAMGFDLLENGEGMEVQKADTNFTVWAEPEELNWKNTPIALSGGKTEMRTRLLPAYLKNKSLSGKKNVAAFGNVYNASSEETYKGTEIEGLIIDNCFGEKDLTEFWNRFAALTFGEGSSATLKQADSSLATAAKEKSKDSYQKAYGGLSCYAIEIADASSKKTYSLGYTGPATRETLEALNMDPETYQIWGFNLDAASFAVQYLDGVNSLADLNSLDLTYLQQFTSDGLSYGGDANYQAVDIMRKLGYTEVLGDVIYKSDAYTKMNMIQEKWDTNNSGIQLVKPLGEKQGLRTVMTPALEEALSQNYANGQKEAKIFEVGHIFSQVEDSDLPYERVSLCFMAYGPDVTMESFTKDVEALVAEYGMTNPAYTTTDVAIAYVVGECTILLNPDDNSTPGNYGPISEIALKNYEIGTQAYMANLEITTLRSY